MEGTLIAGFVLASVGAYLATPVAIRAASRWQFFDHPAGYKGHAAPTPYLGGSAVMAGFVLAMLALAGDADRTLPLAGGVAVLWALGTVDDRRHVPPGTRVAVELALAAGLFALDLGWDVGLGGAVDLALTALWVVAVVNAFNLFDNMDGASSTMACVVAGAVAVLGAVQGDTWLAATGAALAGACLGFLPYNLARPNARIFLGDGGSMPIGFAIAALVMVGASDAVPEWQALVVGLMLVGIPALDTGLVMISRTRRGVSILTGGRDHLTHRTGHRLGGARAVAAALGGAQALVAALALVSIEGGSAAILVAVVLYLVVAGSAIVMLENETQQAAAVGELRTPVVRPAYVALAVLGLGAGLSPFFGGYYDSGTWVPLGLGVVTVGAAVALGRPARLTAAGVLAIVGLAGGAVWAMLSSGWAESAEQALIEGNRMLVLAAVLGLAVVLVRDERRSVLLLGALGAGIAGVAGWVVVRMLGDTGSELFFTGRLHEPLGYINAHGTVFAIGLWAAVAVSERRRPLVAGAGVAAATVFGGLILLTQSRGAALAVFGSALLVLALVPGRRRRLLALACAGAGVALAGSALLDVYDTGGAETQDAARALLLGAVAVGALWGVATWAAARSPQAMHRAGTAAVVAGALVAVVAGAATAGRVTDEISRQYDAFVHIAEPTGSVVPQTSGSRLVSGAGNRYDYWRVAWDAFGDAPLRGAGAGNFDRAWFRERRIAEDVRQPHSIQLQALAETGLVGAAFLALLLAGMGLGAWRTAGVAATSPVTRGVAVAATGGTAAWLIHTSVDWMHLLPGVTAIALCLMAMLVRRRDAQQATERARLSRTPLAMTATVVVAALVVLGGASLGRQGLAEHYRTSALDALPERPADALHDADRSLRLDDEAVRTYHVKAAAQARFDDAPAAQRTLLAATRKEPSDFVTWALLGDLNVRRGRLEDARRFYLRALALNPRDPSLAAAARDPGALP